MTSSTAFTTPREPSASLPDEDGIRETLRQVVDPEVGANIVDLGLIYRIESTPERLLIEMTMTSPACPMGEMITDEVRSALAPILPAGCVADVRLVWQPAWHPGLMSERTRQNLGW